MKKLNLCFTLCLMLSCLQYAEQSAAQSVLFEPVHLLSMEEETIIYDQALLIRDGHIEWMGSSGEYESDDAEIRRVEGPFYVMPGLAEMHAHIPPARQGQQYMEDTLILYLSQGVTTIRGMLGEEAHLDLRKRVTDGELTGPRIFTSGPSFSGNSVQDEDQAREMVRRQVEAGYDLLKFHPGLTVEQFEAITDEANRLGIEFSGHISHRVGLIRSLMAGKGSIDHLDRYMEFLAGNPQDREDPSIIYFGYDLAWDVDETLIPEAARLTREAGVWNVPTNTLLHNVFNPDLSTQEMSEWPGMEFIPESMTENWARFVNSIRESDDYDEEKARHFLDLRDQLTLALHEEGAGIMLGADAPQIFNPPGFSAHRELELYAKAGLSHFEALKTGTVNVARYLGKEDSEGKIAPGYRADLLLLNTNPLESLPNHQRIEAVVAKGVYYSRDELDTMLAAIRARIQDN